MKGVVLFACALALGVGLNLVHGEALWAWQGVLVGVWGGLFGVGYYYWPKIRRFFGEPS